MLAILVLMLSFPLNSISAFSSEILFIYSFPLDIDTLSVS